MGGRAGDGRWLFHTLFPRQQQGPGPPVSPSPTCHTESPSEESLVPSGENRPRQNPADPTDSSPPLSCTTRADSGWMCLVSQGARPQSQNRKQSASELLTGSPVSVTAHAGNYANTSHGSYQRTFLGGWHSTARPPGMAVRMSYI